MALNLAAVVGSDWTLAASIMTFAIPVALFIVVAGALYFLYTRPHAVPGHRDLVPATGAAVAPRPVAPQPPPAQPPGGGYSQGGGYPQGGGDAPGSGGYGPHDGTEGR